jgi:RsiW-degrading membrane proteinase PrsW (M82 family)
MTPEIQGPSPLPDDNYSEPPVSLFLLELGYLALLVGLALLYANVGALRSFVGPRAGPVSLAVPWWGALGGVTISLTGIFRNHDKWDHKYNWWHIARPALGGIVGSVGCLVFVVVIRAANANSGPPNTAGPIFDLVAFLVGYREDVFRALLKRATDFLFTGHDYRGSERTNQEGPRPPDSTG